LGLPLMLKSDTITNPKYNKTLIRDTFFILVCLLQNRAHW
jgi:hypothetical protein